MKKLFLITLAALALAAIVPTMPADAASSVRSTCDASRSGLCAGLISFYQFEEASDYVRLDKLNAFDIYEQNGQDCGSPAGKVNSDGTANQDAMSVNDANKCDYAFIPDYALGSGSWSIVSWIYVDSAGSSDQIQSILNMVGDDDGNHGPHLYVKNVGGGGLHPTLLVLNAVDDSSTSLEWSTHMTAAAWHQIAFGVYPKNDTYGSHVLWMQVDGGTRQTATTTYPIRSRVGDLTFGVATSDHSSWQFTGRYDLWASGAACSRRRTSRTSTTAGPRLSIRSTEA